MEVRDTAAVIAYFGAAWPTFDPSDDTADVWVLELADVDPRFATEAMHNLVRTLDWPPSIARFRQEVATLAVHDRLRAAGVLALTPGPRTEWPKELTEAMKASALEAGSRTHWHGGPTPCRVCGGMDTGYRAPKSRALTKTPSAR